MGQRAFQAEGILVFLPVEMQPEHFSTQLSEKFISSLVQFVD